MQRQPLSPQEPRFAVPGWIPSTFAASPTFQKINWGTLVRLVQFAKRSYDGSLLHASRVSGDFWFEEALLLRLLRRGREELRQQQAASKHPFTTPFDLLLGNYVRHCLRSELAICKDWTTDFDAFVRLRILPPESMVALVGPVKRQLAYSEKHAQHEAVKANDIWLDGGANQYVIDFQFAPNRRFVGQIMGPFRF